METALYFPYSTIDDPFLLKSALVLWDELQYISPGDWLQSHSTDKNILEAIDIVGRPLVPNARAQRHVHERILKFFEEGVPKNFVPVPEAPQFPIYADKFARETWDFLGELQIVDGQYSRTPRGRRHPDYRMGERLAVVLMAALADECAGKTARKVTDADFAQLAHAAVLAKENRGAFLEPKPEHGTCIVKLLTPVIPVADADLGDLVRLRKTESAFLRSLRAKYRSAVDEYIDALSKSEQNDFDFLRIVDGFRRRMEDHMTELDRMLRRRSRLDLYGWFGRVGGTAGASYLTYFLSQDATAALAAGLSALQGVNVFRLLGSIPTSREKREKILTDNPAAWLYEVRQASGGRLPMT